MMDILGWIGTIVICLCVIGALIIFVKEMIFMG